MSRPRDAAATKAALLEAAAELFAERGFDRTTVRDIASLAGVNQALLFRYYGSKDALFATVLASKSRELLEDSPAEHLLRNTLLRMLADDREPGDHPLHAVLRSWQHDTAAEAVRRQLGEEYAGALASLTGAEDAELRADLVLAWLVGIDVRTVLADPRFSRAAVMEPDADVPRSLPDMPTETNILSMDPPDHTRLRKLVAKGFTARRTERLRERAQEIVDGLLDEVEAQGPPADLVEALAMPLPITVICELLGVPFEDRGRFRAWSDAAMAITAFRPEEIVAANAALRGYIAGLVSAKRAEPTDDMLSELVAAHDNEDRLTARELVSFGVTLLVAGHETTANQIGNFAYLLLRDPDRLAELRDDPSLVPAAVEELLRVTPLGGSAGFPRIATAEVELSGVRIAAGEAVFVNNLAANRDPSVFDRPDEVDFHREHNPHITFGHGAHHCIGAPLARMELQVALGTLLKRFPLLRLDGDVAFKKGRLIRGPQSLPVRW